MIFEAKLGSSCAAGKPIYWVGEAAFEDLVLFGVRDLSWDAGSISIRWCLSWPDALYPAFFMELSFQAWNLSQMFLDADR